MREFSESFCEEEEEGPKESEAKRVGVEERDWVGEVEKWGWW